MHLQRSPRRPWRLCCAIRSSAPRGISTIGHKVGTADSRQRDSQPFVPRRFLGRGGRMAGGCDSILFSGRRGGCSAHQFSVSTGQRCLSPGATKGCADLHEKDTRPSSDPWGSVTKSPHREQYTSKRSTCAASQCPPSRTRCHLMWRPSSASASELVRLRSRRPASGDQHPT